MDKFDELFNKVARHDQAGDPSASDLHISDAFEDIVFNKIGRRKKQIRRNIAISIIFMVFGGFFGYFISQNMRVDSARANIKNIDCCPRSILPNPRKLKKQKSGLRTISISPPMTRRPITRLNRCRPPATTKRFKTGPDHFFNIFPVSSCLK